VKCEIYIESEKKNDECEDLLSLNLIKNNLLVIFKLNSKHVFFTNIEN